MNLVINPDAMPVLSELWTRSHAAIGRGIQIVEAGARGIEDESIPNHQGTVTEENGYKFVTEETFDGFRPNSLYQYQDPKNRIVAMYYWEGWDDPGRRQECLKYMTEIRAKRSKTDKRAEYDHKGLGSFLYLDRLPIVGKFFKPDPVKQWCSESSLSRHKKFGCTWIQNTELDPRTSLMLFQWARKFVHVPGQRVKCVLGYYK